MPEPQGPLVHLTLRINRLVRYLSRDAFGGPRVLKLAWVINVQKGGTIPFIAALMWWHGNTFTAAPGGLSVAALGNLVLGIVNRFTHSAAPVIGLEHLPESELAPLPDDKARMAMAAAALEVAQKAWQRLADPNGTLPITHDVYLKLWALTEPKLPADLILLDEAQDANPVLLDLVQRQAAQVVWVEDR